MASPMVILGRRHGVSRDDDPTVIAGPTFEHNVMVQQFKRDFCQTRNHPDFEEVWIGFVHDEKRVKLLPVARPEQKKRKKNEESV